MLIEVTEVYVSMPEGQRECKAIYSEHAFAKIVAFKYDGCKPDEAKAKIIFKDGSEQLIAESPEEVLLKSKGIDPKFVGDLTKNVFGALFNTPQAEETSMVVPEKCRDCKYLGDEDVCRACHGFDHYRKKEG